MSRGQTKQYERLEVKYWNLWRDLGGHIGTLADTIKALQDILTVLDTRRAQKVPEAKAVARAAVKAAFGDNDPAKRQIIAAVPELLEALEILVHERDSLDKDEPVWVLDPAFDIAADAIELATVHRDAVQ